MLKKLIPLLLFAVILSGFAGCMQIVHVTDLQGNPIEGVYVTTSYPAGYLGPPGPSGITNNRGDAFLSIASEPYPAYMNYRKRGYFFSAHGYTTNLKVTKALKPIAGAN